MNVDNQLNIQDIIPLVEKKPVLWDRRIEFFKHKTATISAWNEVCSSYNKAFDNMSESEKKNYRCTIIRKWRNVKDSWRKNLMKTQRGKKSKKYIYDKELLFLKQGMTLKQRRRKSTPSTHTLSSDELSRSSDFQVKSESLNMEFEENDNQHETNSELMGYKKESYENESDFNNKSDSEILPDKFELNEKQEFSEKSSHLDKTELCDTTQAAFHKAPSFSFSQNTTSNIVDSTICRETLSSRYQEDRHVSFIKGVLPSMKNFNEMQVLEFQMGVIQLIQSIRKK